MLLATLRRRLRQIVVASLVLGALGVVAATASRLYIGHKVRTGFEALRIAGVPLTLEELNAQYDAQCPPNGAYGLYRMAFAEMDNCAIGLAEDINGEDVFRLSQGEIERLRVSVDANQQCLALLTEASRMACARFPLEEIDTSLGLDLSRNYSDYLGAQLRESTRLLRIAALDCLVRGDYPGAAEHMVTVIGLSRHLLETPVLLAGLVAPATFGVAEEIIKTGMRNSVWNSDQCHALGTALHAYEAALSDARFESGEFALHQHMMQPPSTGSEHGIWAISEVTGAELESVEAVSTVLPWLVSSIGGVAWYALWEQRMLPAAIRDELARVEAQAVRSSRKSTPFYEGKGNMPSSDVDAPKYGFWKNYTSAKARLYLAACAVESYLAEHGACPESLEALDAARRAWILSDPYTGGKVQYRRALDGFVLYCAGENLADDGGSCETYKGSAWDKDIVLDLVR
jgi:hypothetical protein